MKQKFSLILLCSMIISLSFLKDVSNYLQTPFDRVFLFPHNFPYDQQMFLSEINQAANGRFLFLDKFTSELQKGNIIHPLYIPVGMMAGIFNIPSFVAYQIARFIMGILLLLTTYWFMKQIFPKNPLAQKLAFLFATLLPGYVKIIPTNNGLEFTRYLAHWSGTDLLIRNAFPPHGTLKIILLLCLFVLYLRWSQSLKSTTLFQFITLSVLLILLEPVTILFLGLMLIFISFQEVISLVKKNKTFKEVKKKIILLCLSSVPAFLAFIYMLTVFAQPEWAIVKDWEKKTFFYISLNEYILSFGPLIPLALIGFIIFLKLRTPLRIFVILTSITTIALLFFQPLSNILGLTNFRFFGILLYIFFAAGAAQAIIFIVNKTKGNKTIILFLILFPLIIHIPVYSLMVTKELTTIPGFGSWNNYFYPKKTTYSGLIWLKNHSHLDDVVFSNGYVGNIIPAISGNTVVLGHQISTPHYWDKDRLFYEFINGKMTEKEARKTLTDLRVNYVVIEDWEKPNSKISLYSFLVPILSNPTLAIYKVLP